MIDLFQGTLGSGKSACMTVDLCTHLKAGGVCAANFNLIPGWHKVLASKTIPAFLGFSDVHEKASSYKHRFMEVTSLDDVWRATEELIPRTISPMRKEREGWGRLYLDECQLIFNSRKWGENEGWIHFFSQSRKLKWDVVLVAHSVSMIDKQIRPFIEIESRFRNLSKVHFLGIRCAPKSFPIFRCVKRYAGLGAGAGEIHSVVNYPLMPHYASLYDSHLVFGQGKSGKVQHESKPFPEEKIVQNEEKSSSVEPLLSNPLNSRLCPGW